MARVNITQCCVTRIHAPQRISSRVHGSPVVSRPPPKQARSRSVDLHAFNPNDPMTWNTDEDDDALEMSPQEPEFLSASDLNSLLSTPMTSPTSAEGLEVF